MAARYDFELDAGADFAQSLEYQDETGAPKDLTGYTAEMHVRRHLDDSRVAIGLTNGSGLTLNATPGAVTIGLSSAQTRALRDGTYVYDLELTSPGGVTTRLIQGVIKVSPEVTR